MPQPPPRTRIRVHGGGDGARSKKGSRNVWAAVLKPAARSDSGVMTCGELTRAAPQAQRTGGETRAPPRQPSLTLLGTAVQRAGGHGSSGRGRGRTSLKSSTHACGGNTGGGLAWLYRGATKLSLIPMLSQECMEIVNASDWRQRGTNRDLTRRREERDPPGKGGTQPMPVEGGSQR